MTARLLVVMALGACDWSLHRMQEQPSCKTDESTPLFANGACNQVPPDGIVAFAPPTGPLPRPTRAVLARGRDRFDRFCAPCHGIAGDGDSQVARAMTMRKPPSLVDAGASRRTDEMILVIIERGYGVMPSYREPLPERDRQAVLYYVRALQQRVVDLASLPAAQQQEAKRWLR